MFIVAGLFVGRSSSPSETLPGNTAQDARH